MRGENMSQDEFEEDIEQLGFEEDDDMEEPE